MDIEGIVIRNSQYRDHDSMVSILAKDRIYSVLARGVNKIESKNAHRVSLFVRGTYSILKTQDGYSLKNGSVINGYDRIKSNFDGLVALDFISEITNKIITNCDTESLYDSLVNILDLLNEGCDTLTLLNVYLAKVLRVAGFGLNVDSCQNCGHTTSIVGISYRNGGFICADCFDSSNHIKCSARKLKIFRYLFKAEPKDYDKVVLNKEEAKEILLELIDFTQNIAQLDLKSVELIKKI